MDLLHTLEHKIILHYLASVKHCSHRYVIFNGTLCSFLVLSKDHVHHKLNLIEPFFIEKFMNFILGNLEVGCSESVLTLVTALNKNSSALDV